MSEKRLKKLENQEIEKVSGGYTLGINSACACDNCHTLLSADNVGIPLTGNRHICCKCLAKLKKTLDDDALLEWLKSENSFAKGK